MFRRGLVVVLRTVRTSWSSSSIASTNANPGLPPQSERADHGHRRQPSPDTHPTSITRDKTGDALALARYEHTFATSQRNAYPRCQGAVLTGNLQLIDAAAAGLPHRAG